MPANLIARAAWLPRSPLKNLLATLPDFRRSLRQQPRSFLFPLCCFCFYLLCILGTLGVLCGRVFSFFLNPEPAICCALLFSTVIHKFAQTFLRNFIDAENGKVYLPPQIEPEA